MVDPTSKTHYLSELLPYNLEDKDPENILTVFNEYGLLLESTNKTDQALEKCDYQQLDPIVRDTSCDTRAAYIAKNALLCRDRFKKTKQTVLQIINRIQSISTLYKNDKNCFNELSIKDIFEMNQLDLPITKKELFFVISYILTQVKKINSEHNYFIRTEQTKQILLRNILYVPKRFCIQTVQHLQVKLSKYSVQFVKGLAAHSPNVANRKMQIIKAEDGLQCSPCYETMRRILKMVRKSLPLIIIAQQMSNMRDRMIGVGVVYYVFNGKDWVDKPPELEDLYKPAFVIQGVTCRSNPSRLGRSDWVKTFRKTKIQELVLATSADHNQYPMSILEKHPEVANLIANDPLLSSEKSKVAKLECSKDYPGTFVPYHIFCGSLNGIMYRQLLKYHAFYIHNYLKRSGFLNWSMFTESLYDSGLRPSISGSTIKFTSKKGEINPMFTREVISKIKYHFEGHPFLFFKLKTETQTSPSGELEIKVGVNDLTYSNLSCLTLLEYAKAYPNPSEFLIDHKVFWDVSNPIIIEYLISDPSNFETPELIEALFECLKANKYNWLIDGVIACLSGLSQALSYPHLREKAKSLFFEIDSTFGSHIVEHAWHLLVPVLEDEDTQAYFQKLIDQEPMLYLKFEARSYLNKSIYDKQRFEIEMYEMAMSKNSKYTSIDPSSISLEKVTQIMALNTINVLKTILKNTEGKYNKNLRLLALRRMTSLVVPDHDGELFYMFSKDEIKGFTGKIYRTFVELSNLSSLDIAIKNEVDYVLEYWSDFNW